MLLLTAESPDLTLESSEYCSDVPEDLAHVLELRVLLLSLLVKVQCRIKGTAAESHNQCGRKRELLSGTETTTERAEVTG